MRLNAGFTRYSASGLADKADVIENPSYGRTLYLVSAIAFARR